MAIIPKLSIRLTDNYNSALDEIKNAITDFKVMDELHDPYMVEMVIRDACANSDENIPDDYDFELDQESLYINISHLPKLKQCTPAELSLLEYSFKDSELKLWFYITHDDKSFVFIQAPLSHILENARKY